MALDDDLLSRPLRDEDFAPPSPVSPTPKPEAPSKPATAPSGLDEALAAATKRGEGYLERAEDIAASVEKERNYMNSLKPPDMTDLQALIKSKPAPAKTDPLEAFSSAASLAAIFGSLFTRQPLTNALNNAAGVIEAYKARDKDAAASEFKLWEANLDNAETLFKFQNDAYDSAFKKLETNSKAASDEMRMLTSAFDDTVMKPLIEQGKWREAVETRNHRMALQDKINAARPTLVDSNFRYNKYTEEKEYMETSRGTPLTFDEDQALYNEWMTKPRAASGSVGAGMDANKVADNARQEWKLLFETPLTLSRWKRGNPGKKPPTPAEFEKIWLKERGLKMEDGRAVPIEEPPTQGATPKGTEAAPPKDAPAPRAWPKTGAFKDYPDGSTAQSGGWLWKKQGNKAIPIERVDTFAPTDTPASTNKGLGKQSYNVKRGPDGTLTITTV